MKEQTKHNARGNVQEKNSGTARGGQKQRGHNRKTLTHEKENRITHIPRSKVKESLFDKSSVPHDAARVLEEFGNIVDSVSPLPIKKREDLSRYVKQMSLLLTSCRGERRVGYMNSLDLQAAYVRYFCWWNLVRLTRLLSNMTASFFDMHDGDVVVDLGSGPLTLPIALYLAQPSLRKKRLTWYCVDLSQGALKLGEKLLERVERITGGEAWQVVRVQGGLDAPLKRKATFVSCANCLNELVCSRGDAQRLCEKVLRSLFLHLDEADERARVLLVEPGDPASSELLTHIRGRFIERGFSLISPCTHDETCPMSGKRSGNGKWCNFVFATDGSPTGLKEISRQAGLDKKRASLCFVAMRRTSGLKREKGTLDLRVTGGKMRLEGRGSGWYACCRRGLVVAQSKEELSSGDLLCAHATTEPVIKDGKTGLPIVRV